MQFNLSVLAIAGQRTWRRAKPILLRDTVILPAISFLGIIFLWWVVALANHELMPTPPEALVANFDYVRGSGHLEIGRVRLVSAFLCGMNGAA